MAHHDHHDHSDYVKGTQDISEHKASYDLFNNVTKWGSLFLIVVLTFFIILFAVKGGTFITAFIVSAVLAVLGVWGLVGGSKADH